MRRNAGGEPEGVYGRNVRSAFPADTGISTVWVEAGEGDVAGQATFPEKCDKEAVFAHGPEREGTSAQGPQ